MERFRENLQKSTGQFILTGSANPNEEARVHSGAGRFTLMDMRTMSWQELGFSSAKVSMANLFAGAPVDFYDEPTELEFIIEKIVIGGFPTNLKKSVDQASDLNRAYIELLASIDVNRVSGIKRDPIKVTNLLRSLARNTATLVEVSTLEKDVRESDNFDISRPTIMDYLDTLGRLMIVEDQPAWNTHLRSSATLRKSPKRHFTDVALPVAILGVTPQALINDLNYTGFLFESLVTHDLRVYGQANDAKVYHYKDSSGLEVDAIVQKYNGDWCAFEIKLGIGQIEEAANNLHKFVAGLDLKHVKAPKSLNIITGTGISYTRSDRINVISLASLGA